MKKRMQSYKNLILVILSWATDHTRRYRRSRFTTLILGAILSGCVTAPNESSGNASTEPVTEVTFEHYEVLTGTATRQTVLTGHLLSGTVAELAVLNIDEENDRRLRIYAFDNGTWVPRLTTRLRPDVLFADVAKIGRLDRLVTYEPGRLNWFDPESASEQKLLHVTSNFQPPRKGEIPHVDITQDVNGDERDDLVVPDVDGFWVFIQTPDGTFADPVKIGPPTEMSRILGADGYRYDPWGQSRVHEMDTNQDGRSDLVFWNEDHFEVHLQDEGGLIAGKAENFTTDVPFDSDDLSSLTTGNMTGSVLHSLSDLNGDGIRDLVVYSLEGRRITKKRSTYAVHFGKSTPHGGTAFASEVGATFPSNDRVHLGMDRHDFDGDGQVDVMLTTIENRFLSGSLWKHLKGAMGDSVWLELEFYRNEGGLYPDKPNTVRKVGLDGAPTLRSAGWVPLDIVLRGGTHESRKAQKGWPRTFNTNFLIGDVSGDGRSELLIEETFRGLDLFVGVSGSDLFAPQPQPVAVVVPHDEEYTSLVDLNRDGKQDILMHHPFTLRTIHGGRMRPPGTEPHRLTILIAQ